MEKALSLKEYQQGAYRTEKAELNEALSLIENVLPLYRHAFLKEYWPYIAKNKEELLPYGPKEYSFSTNAMIIVMLLDICKKIKFANDDKEIVSSVDAAKKKYIDEVFKNDEFSSSSKSYGINDPLNLYWAYTICAGSGDSKRTSIVGTAIKNKILADGNSQKLNYLLNFEENIKVEQQEHSFIALYMYRCALKVELHKEIAECYYNFFELRLHQHLSFKSIPDSRFDPAELVFCLEGMLLSKPSSVSGEILHRVFEVLGETQNTTPCWRPVNPIYATQQGQIFLPLSIEVGMSLLSIFYRIDCDSRPQSYFAKYLPMLQRYFRWIKAQKKTICFNDGNKCQEVSGWESEHVGNDGVIHIWQTALILDYLASYARLLKKHIAKQFLISSGLSVQYNEYPQKGKCCIFADSNPFYEFLDISDFKYNVPQFVFKKFMQSRKSKSDNFNCAQDVGCCSKNNCPVGFSCIGAGSNTKEKSMFSLLLYGPPGTGKSFFTKEMARCLKQKHITVTPSDFLANGSAEIEARAKGIFACLMEQEDAVILFDEIDQFILDRDSKRYREQSDVFKLLTPGMLPKFQDLRENAKCIFVIATNYAERIDPAIVRLGRVDVMIPLMPPSWEMRKLMCTEGLSGKGFSLSQCREVATATSLYTWNELTTLIKKLCEKSNEILSSDQSDSLASFIKSNSTANLTFPKVFQRFGWEAEKNDLAIGDSDNHAETMIIEELALMCIIYGINIASGTDELESIDIVRPNLREAVSKKIEDLFNRYNLTRATQHL